MGYNKGKSPARWMTRMNRKIAELFIKTENTGVAVLVKRMKLNFRQN